MGIARASAAGFSVIERGACRGRQHTIQLACVWGGCLLLTECLVEESTVPVAAASRQFRGGNFTNAAGVVRKNYVPHPLQAVLDTAMPASGLAENFDAERQDTHVIMGFQLLRALDGATTDDHADGLRGPSATEY